MNKELLKKAEEFAKNTEFPYSVYFTRKPIHNLMPKCYKYFFVYNNTHKISVAFKTQKELENYIDNKVKKVV